MGNLSKLGKVVKISKSEINLFIKFSKIKKRSVSGNDNMVVRR